MNSSLYISPPWGPRQALGHYPLIADPTGIIGPDPPQAGEFRLCKPVRKIRSNSTSVTGKVPFQGLGRTIRYESTNERDFLLVLRESPIPLGVLEQPLTLDPRQLGFDGRRYTPDFAIWILDPHRHAPRTVLIEIKPDSFLAEDLDWYRQRLMAARRFCRNNGWTFRLITDRRFRSREVPEVVWPSFYVPPVPLLSAESLLRRLFPVGVS